MAILKKRTSSRQLPEARGLDRAPLDSVIRNFNDRPSLTGRGSGSITSDGSGPRPSLPTGSASTTSPTGPITSTITTPKPSLPTATKPPASLTTKTSTVPKTTLAPKTPLTTKPSLTTKPTLTSKTTLPKTTTTTPKTTVKPTITNKTTTTPTTKTTSPTSVVKPTVKPNVSNPNSTTNKVVNALTGAAIGAGTKLLIDKITGKPTVVKTTTGTTKPTTGGTTKPATGGTTKPTTGSTSKPPAGSTTKPPAGSTTKPTAPITSKVLTDEEVQAELDRVKASEENFTPPEGAVDNGDGTYSVTEDGMVTTYNADGSVIGMESAETTTAEDSTDETSGTRGLGGTTVAEGEDDTTVAENADTEYYQDDYGNVYTMNEDGSYELYSNADGSAGGDYADNSYTDPETGDVWTLGDGGMWTLEGDGAGDDTNVADNTWVDEETGAVWTMSDSGEWNTDFNYDDYWSGDDTALADNTDYTDYTENDDYLYAGNDDYTDYDYTDYSDYEYAKRGGLITMMKRGGVPRFANGNLVSEDGMISDYAYSDEGELYQPMAQNEYGDYYTPVLGNQGYYSLSDTLDDGEELFDTDYSDADYSGTDFTPVPGRQYFDDGSYIDTFDDGSTMTYDYDGNLVDTTDGYQTTMDDAGNYIVTDGYGNMTVYDPDGNLIPTGGGRETPSTGTTPRPITSAGGGDRTPVKGNVLSEGWDTVKSLGSDALSSITGALGTTAGAAGAGALIATLLGQDFSGGTGAQNQGLDMSQVGLINPRTTDFGIGPTNFVGYDQYGTDQEDYTPNEELLRNLNAPGYNPVREGDYGYEEETAEEEVPAMASGGLSSMATPVASYYTFGQPADIMANLGMRPQPPMNRPEMMPQIGQQQPQQQPLQQAAQKFPQPSAPQMAPPQLAQQMPHAMTQSGAMPTAQGMAPPMRKGGLPHVSNVPLTQGRMDFRKGAAVHGAGDGQSDDIPAMLADGEYVIDAETVAQIGNGSTKAGAQALDKFREGIRAHKRSAPINKIPPKTKPLTSYLKGAK